ncbi:recombinase family protein [Kineococcus sp. SYSU DK006]|uniref:recombinase family protein n=1 Tax=Kineococcus sp. SYSU DK006 TaxID=3383127 RepID=UPI003D7DE9C5
MTAQLLGYARVSTTVQDPALQQDALRAAGCSYIWTDTASGALAARPALEEVLNYAREGDTLVVWRLDRLGRSLPHLLTLVDDLAARDVGLRSLREAIDTTTAAGRLVLSVFGALAEFERELIRERTRAGLDAAAARGRRGGRPSVMTPAKLTAARAMLAGGEHTVTAAAAAIGVSRASLYRALREQPAVSRA